MAFRHRRRIAILKRRRVAARGLLTCAALSLIASGCPDLPLPGPPANGDIGGMSDYVGADICFRCHTDTHTLWSASKHAHAIDSLRTDGHETDGACLSCHATGYGQRGFVSETLTPGLAGVQCEACHGPGANHVGSRSPADIVRVPGTAVCGKCHTGPQQPDHDEWLMSRHAQSLQSVRQSPQRADSCLACHSYDYALTLRANTTRQLAGKPPLPLPSIVDENTANDPIEAVGCSACHQPHGSSFTAQLRMYASAACAGCHSDLTVAETAPPHAPQRELLLAERGRALDGATNTIIPLPGYPAVHSTIDELGGCARCHGVKSKSMTPTVDNPNKHGHLFDPEYNGCLPCHGADEARTLVTNLKAEIEPRVAALRQRIAGIDRSALFGYQRDMVDAATYDLDLIDADHSVGIHNPRYARQLLDAVDQLLNRATGSS